MLYIIIYENGNNVGAVVLIFDRGIWLTAEWLYCLNYKFESANYSIENSVCKHVCLNVYKLSQTGELHGPLIGQWYPTFRTNGLKALRSDYTNAQAHRELTRSLNVIYGIEFNMTIAISKEQETK